jgi:serine/threonine protein kinase
MRGVLLALALAAYAATALAQAGGGGDRSSFVPRDDILLDCGATGQGNNTDGRVWAGDAGSKYLPPKLDSVATTSQNPSVPQVPYLTARASASPFTFSFPLGPGRKFLRLHFYPANYTDRDAADALFSVTVAGGKVTLLSNFSALQTATALNYDYFVREFSVNVTSQTLDLAFTPEKDHPNAYAFINGIEVVSSPDLFDISTPNLVTGDGNNQPFPIEPGSSLQTMYRLNVGGQSISPSKDTGGYRSWDDDTPYVFGAGFGVTYPNDEDVTIRYRDDTPQYVAPLDVYSTARSMGPDQNVNKNTKLEWMMQVDAGFTYLVRLHFCEIQDPITKINQRVFNIEINNQTAFKGADVIAWAIMAGATSGSGSPVFQDFVVNTVGSGAMDLWVAIYPDVDSTTQMYDAILNGMEVFKLQLQNGSLAGLNPIPSDEPSEGTMPSKKSGAIGPIVGGVVGGLVVLALGFCLFVICRRKRTAGKDAGMSDGHSGWLPLSLYGHSHTSSSAKSHTTGSYASSLPSNLCRHFSFAEIKAATNNFDESLILGVGGFGKVYRGEIDGGTTKVAIKRGNPMSEQGVHEFQTEIEMLSKLRHRHLVSLIGYCEEKNEMILVYDYMAHGTMREHLYKTQNPPLTWRQRLDICIGAARGLHYLHTGAKHTIIHRDVKTTNILLDEKWVAKVSDFGLSKTGPSMDHTHVSTVVKGSFGYLDPEYFRRQQLTDKSDVYSFGVVLFEVLCARPALNPTLPKEEVSLAEWALHCQKKGILDQIVDPYLKGKIAPQCFRKFAETAEKCVSDQGINRPSMGDVLWNLEFALQMQESAEDSGSLGCGMSDEGTPLMMPEKKDPNDPSIESSTTTTTTTSISMGDQSVASIDSDGLTPSAVFSQIMNPKGR